MYSLPIYFMFGICVAHALRYLINSFACVILNNKFTPRSRAQISVLRHAIFYASGSYRQIYCR